MKKITAVFVLMALPVLTLATNSDKLPNSNEKIGKPERVEALHEAIEVRQSSFEEAKQVGDLTERQELNEKSREEFWDTVHELYEEDLDTTTNEVSEEAPLAAPAPMVEVTAENLPISQSEADEANNVLQKAFQALFSLFR